MSSAKPAVAVKYNKSSPGVRRILKEAQEIATSPSRDFTASPLEHNLFEWHFTLRGPPAPSPFADGFYHGRIILSPNYPMRPPMFRFLTDSGRFEVNRDICLSISGFHEETWQPSWSIRLALIALRAHMDADPEGQVGALSCTPETRKELAVKSRSYRCSECGGGGEEDAMKIPEDEEGSSGAANAEPEIPKELRFGYKDQMKPRKEEDTTAAAATKAEEEGSAAVTAAPSTTSPEPQPQLQQKPSPPAAVQRQEPPARPQEQRMEDQPEPAMFIPFASGQHQQQQQLAGGAAGNNIPAPVIPGTVQAAAPRRFADTTAEDRTNGYIDLAIGALLCILVALVLKKTSS